MKTINHKLGSGRELKITIGSIGEGQDLWIALNKEVKGINLKSDVEIDVNLAKDVFCTLNSSREVFECMKPLLKRCLYNGDTITDKTFEDYDSREDYIEVLELVARENVLPFAKGLLRKYGAVIQQLKSIFQKLKEEKTAT